MTREEKKDCRDFLMFSKLDDKFEYRDTGCGIQKHHDFNIRFCNNSKLYVHERVAEVKIDQCSDCEIVVGPTVSSVFLRNVKDSRLVIICKQLRMRDCENLEIQLYS
jgi:hypothetical protein